MASHTPGPFTVTELAAIIEISASNGVVAHIRYGYPRPDSYHCPIEETRANARLIAHAPELLAELERLTAVVDYARITGHIPIDACDKARAAIRAARGE